MFNRLIFPAPTPSYGTGVLQGELLHIPRNLAEKPKLLKKQENQQIDHGGETTTTNAAAVIPSSILLSVRLSPAYYDFTCGLFIRGSNANAKHIVMYCHPNAVDVGHMRSEFVYMARNANIHCLLVEFQGYGLLQSCTPSEQQATEDGFAAFNFITKTMGFPANKVIMMGRSIGTGVACQVAAQLQQPDQVPLAILLQCPFTSIKACVKSLAGKNFGDFASEMVGERFQSIKNITKIKCPVAIVHGVNDTIVPFQHGVDLTRAAVEAGKTDTVLIQVDSDHNDLPLEPGLVWIRDVIAKDNAASHHQHQHESSSPSPTLDQLADRVRPYFGGPPVYQDMQQGRSRPMPLTKVPSSTLPGSSAISRAASNIITSPFSHLSQTISYNTFSFLSLVRTAWELYQMVRDEALARASGSEQVMQYVNMLAPTLVSNAVASLRDKSSQLADLWKMSDFIELCAYLWGHPLSLGHMKNSNSNNKSTTSASSRFVFGTSCSQNDDGVFSSTSSSNSMPSHYDEIWVNVANTLRETYREVQEYAAKIQKEQEEYETTFRKQHGLLERETKSTTTSSPNAADEEKVPMVSSNTSSQPQWEHPGTASPSSTALPPVSMPPFKSSLPPFSTASAISQHSVRTQDFDPSLLIAFPPTLLKIFSDNLEKSKRTAAETMRRIEERVNSPLAAADEIPMKPQPVTEKGAQWVQVEIERFVISNLLLGQQQQEQNNNRNVLENLELIEKSILVSSAEDSEYISPEIKKWKQDLSNLLHSPYLDGVLLPLPIAVDSDEAMKDLLKLFRNAPKTMAVEYPVLDNVMSLRGGGGGNGDGSTSGGAKKNSADCVIQ